MANAWYHAFHRLCNAVYFNRITVLHPDRLPRTGPALYLGLHRNGAVDGFIYHTIVPDATFLISTQLRKNPLGKLFFTGIEIVRTKDEGDRDTNVAALERCRELLRAGGSLFVFPEGTSSLGPRHLPFKSGAIQILLDFLDAGGGPISVIPLGIHYECPWAFRRNVEVVVGKPVSVDRLVSPTPLGRLKEMKHRAQAGLEAVGVNVESAVGQEMSERLAYVATLATSRSYFQTLKAVEKGIPPKLAERWQSLEPELQKRKLWYHQGVPLFPMNLCPERGVSSTRSACAGPDAVEDPHPLPTLGPLRFGTNRGPLPMNRKVGRGVPAEPGHDVRRGPARQGWRCPTNDSWPQRAILESWRPPMSSTVVYGLAFISLGLLVVVGGLCNLPPLLAGWWAGKKFPDGPNVISLWKILVGMPAFILWALAVATVGLVLGKWFWLAGYLLATWLGLKNYYRVRKLAVAVHNGWGFPGLGSSLLAFRELVLQEIPDESA